MALLLHLSDLHLGEGDSPVGDYSKDATLKADQHQTRLSSIKASILDLAAALEADKKKLDSVVITGDITSHSDESGFRLLPELLNLLGSSLPSDQARILVVPGNHDVDWAEPATSRDRYGRFLILRDEFGYSTPHLEGVDVDSYGNLLPLANARPTLLASDESFVLAGMNSSNNCGVPGAITSAVTNAIRGSTSSLMTPALKTLLEALDENNHVDMARVDLAQFTALSLSLSEHLAQTSNDPLRLLALHHQIAPVGLAEEIKAFESVINLGALRGWIASNGIDVVLHGHKHEMLTLSERFTPPSLPQKEHRVLVLSAPSIQAGQTKDFGRLLDIPPIAPRFAGITVVDVPGRITRASYPLGSLNSRHEDIDDAAESGVIVGETASDVHLKLLAIQDRIEKLPTPLICRFSDGLSALTASPHLLDVPAFSTPQEWFDTTVKWWQRHPKGKAATFNHGERLFSARAGEKTQLDSVIEALGTGDESSRAIALLATPEHDLLFESQEYPAFVSVQFIARGLRIDVIAYFRKQEMPHWWPINAGELANLLNHVVSRLQSTKSRAYFPGSISTVTAIARGGSAIPRVSVPLIDQMLDTPGAMLELILPLLSPAPKTSTSDAEAAWANILDDWAPTSDRPTDGDPIPIIGLRDLASSLESAAELFASPKPMSRLIQTLRQLASSNESFDRERRQTKPLPERREQWRSDVEGLAHMIKESIVEILSEQSRV